MYNNKYHIHFVGIGGIGMSGIAELLLNLQYRVSGSDLKSSDITRRLQSLGGKVYEGHAAHQIEGADVVVTSSAVKNDNPEVVAAQRASVPVIPRAEMLAELMRLKYSIAVAGAHGKTTTTSIISAVLDKGGIDPTVVIGGKLKSLGTNAVLGSGDFIVAEADESDGSFLRMTPTIAVVTNIDNEHLDFYENMEGIKESFASFINKVPFYGLGVLCLDNDHIQDIIPDLKKRYTTYGMTSQADFQAKRVSFDGLKSSYTIYHLGHKIGDIKLNLPGIHNVYNSMASIAVGLELGVPFETIKQALEEMEGVQRRMEIKGEIGEITIIDDYGHHPTEIKSTLAAVRESFPDRRLVVLFQPHRYTRTRDLFEDFTRAFYQTDALIVLPVYAAGEKPIEGIDSDVLCEGIKAHGHRDVMCIDDAAKAVIHLKNSLRKGDVVLTLGAGNVWRIGEDILAELKNADR